MMNSFFIRTKHFLFTTIAQHWRLTVSPTHIRIIWCCIKCRQKCRDFSSIGCKIIIIIITITSPPSVRVCVCVCLQTIKTHAVLIPSCILTLCAFMYFILCAPSGLKNRTPSVRRKTISHVYNKHIRSTRHNI